MPISVVSGWLRCRLCAASHDAAVRQSKKLHVENNIELAVAVTRMDAWLSGDKQERQLPSSSVTILTTPICLTQSWTLSHQSPHFPPLIHPNHLLHPASPMRTDPPGTQGCSVERFHRLLPFFVGWWTSRIASIWTWFTTNTRAVLLELGETPSTQHASSNQSASVTPWPSFFYRPKCWLYPTTRLLRVGFCHAEVLQCAPPSPKKGRTSV